MEISQITLDDLVASIRDGDTLGIGGAGLQRKPMAALSALAAGGRRDLSLVSFLGSVDVELLLAANAVGTLHSAGVSLEGGGLAPRYRAARQDGSVTFVEWSEGTLLCALQATSRGVPSLPTWMALDTDMPTINDALLPGHDPFTGEPVMHVRALTLDLALLHVPAIDSAGNVYVEGDFALDGALARSAERTIVCYEEVIDPEPGRATMSRLWVDGVIPASGGAWPSGCHPAYPADLEAVARWAAGGADGDLSLLSRETEATR